MATDEGYPYRRIVTELRQQILSADRAPGDRLPSESELAAIYRTSRPTVRRALAVLRGEGLIVTGQGSGTFVRPRPGIQICVTGSNYRLHRALGLPGFNAQVLAQGQSPRQDITEVARIAAPADVAEKLDLDEGSSVIVRRRIFLADGVPIALTDSYYPVSLAAGTKIEEPERLKGGVHALIEDENGPIRRKIVRSDDDITARMPTPDEADLLRLPAGVPVFRVLRTIYDSNGQPVELQDTVAAADRHRFRYEVDMGDAR
jgi:GntR family transcriptional regulator